MDTETALKFATELLAPWTRSATNPEANRLVIVTGMDLLAYQRQAVGAWIRSAAQCH